MITEKVTSMLVEGLVRHAAKYDASPLQTQLNISLRIENNEAFPRYKVLKKYSEMEEVTINGFRQVKIDIVGIGDMVSSFIVNKLVAMADELAIDYNDISAMVVLKAVEGEDDEFEPCIFIYDGANSRKKISVADLLA